MAHNRRDDDLAYGDYHGQQEGQEGDRGMIGDMGRRLFGGKKEVRNERAIPIPLPVYLADSASIGGG